MVSISAEAQQATGGDSLIEQRGYGGVPADMAEAPNFYESRDRTYGANNLATCLQRVPNAFGLRSLQFDPRSDFISFEIRDCLSGEGDLREDIASFLSHCGGFVQEDLDTPGNIMLVVKTDASLSVLGPGPIPACSKTGRPELHFRCGVVPITGFAPDCAPNETAEAPKLVAELAQLAEPLLEERREKQRREEAEKRSKEAARRGEQRRKGRAAGRFSYCEVRAGDAADAVPWLFPGVVRSDVPLLIGGPEKRNKSYLALWLAVARSEGAPFFGKELSVDPAPVVFVSGEGSYGELGRRVARIRKFLGVGDSGNLRLFNVPSFSIADEAAVGDCVAVCRQFEPEMIVFDPATRMLGGEGKGHDVQAMYERFQALEGVVSQFDCVCQLVATWHFKELTRNQRLARPERSMLAGTGPAQWARQWLLVNDRTKWDGVAGGQWVSYGSAEHSGDLATTFTTAGGGWSCEWRDAPRSASAAVIEPGAAPAVESSGLTPRQLNVLLGLTVEPRSISKIGEGVGVRHNLLKSELGVLANEGYALAVDGGGKNPKYRLADPPRWPVEVSDML